MPEELGLVRDFAIVMAAAGAALVLFRKLGQPAVLAYLLAGIIIGPFVLPSLSLEDTGTVRLLADLGLVLLLFAMGLEMGWERLRRIGLRVILIGAIEITFMIALGYEIGILLGWSATEAIFLGAALSISSSAILLKVLKDAGKLYETHGRLIVGILAVEDFAAVILLTLLSGVATTGTATLSDVGYLAGKLALFSVSALVLGGVFAPRFVRFVARFESREVLMIAGLGLCFGLALVAHELGLSAAAGAFLIGTVLGDSEHSQSIIDAIGPVRDMFAALFFVSIGMLVDLSLFAHFIGPALIVSLVFILGKVIANTIGTFFVGHDGRTSLAVGMGMPQMGEFSLAMVKVGAERGAVGASLYPVVTVTTAITSFLYPFIFRSADATASFLERRSPVVLKHYVSNMAVWLNTLRTTFVMKSEAARQIQGHVKVTLINVGIIMVLIAAGTFALRYTHSLTEFVPISESVLGLGMGIAAIAVCIPSVVAIWRELRGLAEELTTYLFNRRPVSSRPWPREDLRVLLRDSLLAAVTVLLMVWTIPFVSQLLLIGRFSIPLPILLLAGVVLVTGRSLFKIHGVLVTTFSRTFLGERESEPGPGPAQEWDVHEHEGEG